MKKFLWVLIGGAVLVAGYLYLAAKKAAATVAAGSSVPPNPLASFWTPQGNAIATTAGQNVNLATQAASQVQTTGNSIFSSLSSLWNSGAKGPNSPSTSSGGSSAPVATSAAPAGTTQSQAITPDDSYIADDTDIASNDDTDV